MRLALGPLLFALAEWTLGWTGVMDAGARHALAATLWIATWWLTEALPVGVTALLPLVVFPVLGLGEVGEVSSRYADGIIFLFLGGLILAQAMENTGLHRRVALGIVGLFGRTERGLVFGLMAATAFLSMWISNTATVVMILPVVLAVLVSRRRQGEKPCADESIAPRVDDPLATAMLLGVAFAANIGGFGTPIASPPTVVFQSIYEQKTGESVSFAQWMAYGVPLIVVLLPLVWWLLTRRLPPAATGPDLAAQDRGPLAPPEKLVAWVSVVAATLWVTRGGLGPLPSWGDALAANGWFVQDSTIAVAVVVVLFSASACSRAPFLRWDEVAAKLPWGVLLLMGAGFAISSAFDSSGLTAHIGSGVASIGGLGASSAATFSLLVVTVVAISILLTEFASNTASASILLPIVFGACVAIEQAVGVGAAPPLLIMVACTLACTAGFAMPVGTPPNALAFSTGRISMRRFVSTGLVVDLMSLVAISLMLAAWHLFRSAG